MQQNATAVECGRPESCCGSALGELRTLPSPSSWFSGSNGRRRRGAGREGTRMEQNGSYKYYNDLPEEIEFEFDDSLTDITNRF